MIDVIALAYARASEHNESSARPQRPKVSDHGIGLALLLNQSGVSRRWGLSLVNQKGEPEMGLIFLIVLIILLLGALPAWPYSRGWGYGPSGGLGLLVLIVIILLLLRVF